MATVKELLNVKPREIWYVTLSATIGDALKLMSEKGIGAVPVLDGAKIVGIFSERDFARHAVAVDCLSLSTPVRQLMVHPVLYVTPDQSVEDVMAVMTAKRFRHLPVLENEQLIGMISIGDVVKHSIEEKEDTIKSLEHFLWSNML